MPDRRALSRREQASVLPNQLPRRCARAERSLTALAAASLVVTLVAALLAPASAMAVPLPGESCPVALPGSSSAAVCGEGRGTSGGGGGGTGSLDMSGLLAVLGAAVGGAAIALAAAFLVLRRRASAPVAPADPAEWWTCRSCGKTNVIGSPRCYACGSWQS